jgi:hypothetical protein
MLFFRRLLGLPRNRFSNGFTLKRVFLEALYNMRDVEFTEGRFGLISLGRGCVSSCRSYKGFTDGWYKFDVDG